MDFLDIFSAQIDCLDGHSNFGFGPNLCLRQLFKESNRQALRDNFASIFPSNSYNFCLESFWTFSLIITIVF